MARAASTSASAAASWGSRRINARIDSLAPPSPSSTPSPPSSSSYSRDATAWLPISIARSDSARVSSRCAIVTSLRADATALPLRATSIS